MKQISTKNRVIWNKIRKLFWVVMVPFSSGHAVFHHSCLQWNRPCAMSSALSANTRQDNFYRDNMRHTNRHLLCQEPRSVSWVFCGTVQHWPGSRSHPHPPGSKIDRKNSQVVPWCNHAGHVGHSLTNVVSASIQCTQHTHQANIFTELVGIHQTTTLFIFGSPLTNLWVRAFTTNIPTTYVQRSEI